MPALANTRHERFAQELAKGKSATEAMQEAGYSDPRNSTRLTKNDEIRRRVSELQERGAIRTEITLDRLTEMLLEDRRFARENGQSGPAGQATERLGKLHGLFVERTENVSTTYVVSGEPVDDINTWAAEHTKGH